MVSNQSVTERTLANHAPGSLLNASVTQVSNTVNDTHRTVVLKRSRKGASSLYYTFDPVNSAKIDFIAAFGKSLAFGYHASRGLSSLTLVALTK